MNVGARPSVLKEELVNENSRDEPVCLMHSGGLVIENSRDDPVCLMHSGGLVIVNVGARPSVLKGELVKVSSWARGFV